MGEHEQVEHGARLAHFDQAREEAIRVLRAARGAFFVVCDVPADEVAHLAEEPVVFATGGITCACPADRRTALVFYRDVHERAAGRELAAARAFASDVTRGLEEREQ
ncbi:MAG: hypothetical protein R3C15_15625 [Thermoleophilia bacterium]